MNWFETLWDKDNAPTNFSDSSVFRNGDTCVKIYDELDEDTVRRYHKIHNRLSSLSYIINSWWDYKRERFERTEIVVLGLWDDIWTFFCEFKRKNITYSKVPFTQWGDIVDFIDGTDEGYLNILFDISWIAEYIFQDFAVENGIWMYHSFNWNVIPSLNAWYNVRVVWVEEWVLKIVITDLASVISIFVEKYNDLANDLL